MIPTAEEFLLEFEEGYPRLKCEVSTPEDKASFYRSAQGAIVTIDLMIEFAKLHVEAALKAASENVVLISTKTAKQSILNAYPLTNIK
jgi:hypothetical protein